MTIFLCLTKPVFDIVKRFAICQIKDKHNTLRSLIISWSDSSKLFLPSCVPHLQFDNTSSLFNSSNFEVYSNSRKKSLMKDVVWKSKQQTGFANWWVTNEQYFENEIVLIWSHDEAVYETKLKFIELYSNTPVLIRIFWSNFNLQK